MFFFVFGKYFFVLSRESKFSFGGFVVFQWVTSNVKAKNFARILFPPGNPGVSERLGDIWPQIGARVPKPGDAKGNSENGHAASFR
jgi:hypothetical protein